MVLRRLELKKIKNNKPRGEKELTCACSQPDGANLQAGNLTMAPLGTIQIIVRAKNSIQQCTMRRKHMLTKSLIYLLFCARQHVPEFLPFKT